jgi:hypothetical protein
MNRIGKKRGEDCSRRTFWICAAGIILLRLVLCAFQQDYIWVGGAPLDDELMFRAAQSISAGQWLGAYDYLTLSKGIFFAVWLAFLHLLRVPYLLGGQALWCGAALFAAQAFAPVLPRRKSRLLLFGILAWSPAACAAFTLRVYRDNIFPALCLLLFAGLAAAVLRAGQTQKCLWPWLLGAGFGLAAAWLTREDAAAFLLPFALLGTALLAVRLVRARARRRLPALAVPYLILAIGIITVCTLNYNYYGLFALSDFSTGSFADAIGAMTRVESQKSRDPLVSIPADVRQSLYCAVPELAPLGEILEQDAQMRNDFLDSARGDYRSGSFYWAIRRAAQQQGIYRDAATADAYWSTVAEKINALCDDGTLPSRFGRRSGTTPPITAAYVPPVLQESAKSALWVLTFQDCAPYSAQRSIGTQEDFAQWDGYLGSSANGAAEAGKDTPYYSPYQKLAFGFLQAVRFLYAAALPVAFVLALVLWLRRLVLALRRREHSGRTLWLILSSFLLAAAYRCAMIAFVEVSSFGIGTSTMYLATVHPLLLLFAGVTLLTERRAHNA